MRGTKKLELTHDQWIWDKENQKSNSWVVFCRTFQLEELPEEAQAYAAADTKYWLYVNGELAVFEGSLFRESVPGGGYVDAFDLAPFLKNGENRIDVLVWYHGNEGRNSISSGHAGFFFSCEELALYSDLDFLCCTDTSFYLPEPVPKPMLHGGCPIGYRSGGVWQSVQKGSADPAVYHKPVLYSVSLWGDMYLRPIPLHKTSAYWEVKLTPRKGEPEPGDLLNAKCLLEGRFPYAMAVTPRIYVKSKYPVTIRICTDRYRVAGGPGDEDSFYENHYYEFACGGGEESFAFPWYLYGERLLVSCDGIPEQLRLECMESGYDAAVNGSFVCENELLNVLVKKSARTLFVCMRDNFFDCPDRERGQWIGDVSVQVPQVFYLLEPKGALLVKKAIYDFITLRRGDILQGNVPGRDSQELPAQSLCAISEWGMIAKYYHFTKDLKTLSDCYEPMGAYLKLWEFDENGLVPRKGDWQWYDHLYNQDETVMEYAWYYSALRFLRSTSKLLGKDRFDDLIQERMEKIEAIFSGFWNGSAYTSGGVVDDRANALAVLSGLCPKEHYRKVAKVLVSVCNASVYMENFVLTALCEMGDRDLACQRMISRYYPLAVNENSTLWEDFYILGTRNHAWSGAPCNIAFRYFLGIDSNDGYCTFSVNPAKEVLKDMEARIGLEQGTLHIQVKDGVIRINGKLCEAGRVYGWEEV